MDNRVILSYIFLSIPIYQYLHLGSSISRCLQIIQSQVVLCGSYGGNFVCTYLIFTIYILIFKTLSTPREQYKSVSGGVTERSRLLSQITDDLGKRRPKDQKKSYFLLRAGGATNKVLTPPAPLFRLRANGSCRANIKNYNFYILT